MDKNGDTFIELTEVLEHQFEAPSGDSGSTDGSTSTDTSGSSSGSTSTAPTSVPPSTEVDVCTHLE
jgi:hypothetical protein